MQKEIKISFVGDILPGNLPYTKGFGNYKALDKDSLIQAVDKPEIFFANLESPVLLRDGNNESFSGNPRIIEVLKKQGINIVSISNNHILEHGNSGFFETIKLLRENNIKVIGIYKNGTSNIETFRIGDQLITLAAFNAVHDINNPALYAELNQAGIELALEEMEKAGTTFKILTFHWGNEYISLPNPEQVKTARFAIEKGCDLIIGHHPHVVQKVEIINNKYVFYSLGNAYFDYLFTSKVKKGLRVNCRLANQKLDINYHYISSHSIGFKKIKGNIDVLRLSEKEIERQNSNSYSRWFSKKIRHVRFIYRLKMKFFLLELLFTLKLSNKLILIKNTKQVLLSKSFK